MKSYHQDDRNLIPLALAAIRAWEKRWQPFEAHVASAVEPERLQRAWDEYVRLLGLNAPFFHPRYAGQMLKPPHPAAMLGYLAAMLINPNNHAADGGAATGEMEREVVREIAGMFRFPDDALGHLTSGGTLANTEALWVSRELRPSAAVAYSDQSHYTHERMCGVLGIQGIKIASNAHGEMDLDALETALQGGNIGTVVVTAGTTGVGAVDPIDRVLELRDRYGFRVHVDAAYGGFFTLLAWGDSTLLPVARFRAIAQCDSVVVDPHKHGLQPYGCGCVIFRDPAVAAFYKHDSPYTYFTSDTEHLGEISLECSRPGAAAGALWLTLRCLPLAAGNGLGPMLEACLRAARNWSGLLAANPGLNEFVSPTLDIVTYFPGKPRSVGAIDEASTRLFDLAMRSSDPVYLSLLRVGAQQLRERYPALASDAPQCRILRSVLMKPEHEHAVEGIHQRLLELLNTPD
ncbi:MAG: pyridoxal phosphate-dependent decarboxylase family protein [Burkholderiales bacterium]